MESLLEGHNLPTGFAFARQMWLEVHAETSSGTPVCLEDVEINGQIIKSDCASGKLESPQAELLTCDPLALAELGLKASKNDELVKLNPRAVAPLSRCDPWSHVPACLLVDSEPSQTHMYSLVQPVLRSGRCMMLCCSVSVSRSSSAIGTV